jgi:simple sugar transport system substrate-binding protein
VKPRIARLVLVPVVLLSLVVAACGGGTSPASSGGAVKVGVVLKTANDFFNAMKSGIEAMPKNDVDLLGIEAPGNGSEAQPQINAIQNMVTRGAQAIVVSPVGPQVLPTLQQAISQGVKVVLVNDYLPELQGESPYIGTDNFTGGKLAGAYLKEQLKGTGTVAIMSGIPGVPALDDRVNGVLEQLKGTNIKVVTTLATQCDQTQGLNVMQAIGSSHPEVDAVYSACGPPMLGAIQARQKQDPFKKNLLLVGFDCLPDEAKAIAAGTETASVAQFPQKMGTTAVRTAVDVVRGKQVPARTDSGTQLVDKRDAQKFTTFQ